MSWLRRLLRRDPYPCVGEAFDTAREAYTDLALTRPPMAWLGEAPYVYRCRNGHYHYHVKVRSPR